MRKQKTYLIIKPNVWRFKPKISKVHEPLWSWLILDSICMNYVWFRDVSSDIKTVLDSWVKCEKNFKRRVLMSLFYMQFVNGLRKHPIACDVNLYYYRANQSCRRAPWRGVLPSINGYCYLLSVMMKALDCYWWESNEGGRSGNTRGNKVTNQFISGSETPTPWYWPINYI